MLLLFCCGGCCDCLLLLLLLLLLLFFRKRGNKARELARRNAVLVKSSTSNALEGGIVNGRYYTSTVGRSEKRMIQQKVYVRCDAANNFNVEEGLGCKSSGKKWIFCNIISFVVIGVRSKYDNDDD